MDNDDLVERLRNENYLWTVPGALRKEAADEIERLYGILQAYRNEFAASHLSKTLDG